MKRKISKNIFAITGILFTLACSVLPYYTAYATGTGTEEEQPDQTVTSDDSIVQKLYNYVCATAGAVNRGFDSVTKLPSTIENNVKEYIASLLNGGGIYVDDNGDYVFSDEATQGIYDAMLSNSNIDARVVSNFNNFSYQADGYVNGQFILNCNALTLWGKTETESGDYFMVSQRFNVNNGSRIETAVYCYDISNVAYIVPDTYSAYIQDLGGNVTFYIFKFYNSSGTHIYVPCKYFESVYTYSGSGSYYTGDIQTQNNVGEILAKKIISNNAYPLLIKHDFLNGFYNSFPTFPSSSENNMVSWDGSSGYYRVPPSNIDSIYFYCNKSFIIAKNIVSANTLNNQTEGVYVEQNNIGTVNKTVVENNNWETIYSNYVTNVNIDYQEDTGMSASDFRKIQKKYTTQIINAIQEGSENIEEKISLSNRYLQAISVDVRNIIDWLNANGTSGGSGGTSSGLTPEQANTLISLLNQIDNNCQDIASGVTTLVDDDMDVIEQGIGDTNQNLLAIQTALDSIYNKIGTKSPNQPVNLPVDYTDLLDALENTADGKVEQALTVMDAVGLILRTVAPFGYISLIGIILGNLDVEPVEPKFVAELNNASDDASVVIDTDMTIDLTWVADLIPVLHAGIVILFIIGLAWASFYIFQTIGMLFV